MTGSSRDRVVPAVHPEAFIAPGATVVGEVTLGRESSVWYGCVLRGDVAAIELGEASNLQDLTVVHVDAGEPARIGPRVGVGHHCLLHGCTIEEECLIGMGAIVLSGAVIERGSVIAAGALVTEGMRVPAGSLAMGMPARIVRPVDDALRKRIEHTWRNYVRLAREHRAGRYAPPAGGAG